MRFLAIAIIPFFILASCASKTFFDQLSQKESDLKYKADFRSYLGLEYLDFARNLMSVGDEEVAEYFSNKGYNIINYGDIISENPIKWDADQAQIELMIMMQKRLEDLIVNSQLQRNIPIQLAHLTFLYDCWISRESKSIYIADELARCRVRFTKLLNEIEYYLTDLRRDKTQQVIIEKPDFELFRILFDFNSYKLNDMSNKKLFDSIEFIKKINNNYRILLVGNADRSGNVLYNKSLSIKRINTVKNYLIKNGIPNDFIETKALGEEFPDILTVDGKKKQANRSVEIYVLIGKGQESFDKYPVPFIKNFVYQKEIKKVREDRGLKN